VGKKKKGGKHGEEKGKKGDKLFIVSFSIWFIISLTGEQRTHDGNNSVE